MQNRAGEDETYYETGNCGERVKREKNFRRGGKERGCHIDGGSKKIERGGGGKEGGE